MKNIITYKQFENSSYLYKDDINMVFQDVIDKYDIDTIESHGMSPSIPSNHFRDNYNHLVIRDYDMVYGYVVYEFIVNDEKIISEIKSVSSRLNSIGYKIHFEDSRWEFDPSILKPSINIIIYFINP